MEKKATNAASNTDNELKQDVSTQESELPSLKELDRRVPSLPHDEESEDAWV